MGNEKPARGGASSWTPKASPASSNQSSQRLDPRRKLSSRDYLVIQLSAKNHSLSQLSRIFQVHVNTIRKIVRSPNLWCPTCKRWKDRNSGVIFRSEIRSKTLLWICNDCVTRECQ
jgi:DNA-binding CsgD family transcriptional regulator